jgi:acyl-CoA thioesterase FadM
MGHVDNGVYISQLQRLESALNLTARNEIQSHQLQSVVSNIAATYHRSHTKGLTSNINSVIARVLRKHMYPVPEAFASYLRFYSCMAGRSSKSTADQNN